MSGGLRYETGRDMPPGMAEKVAVQIARQLEATTSPAPPETPPVAGGTKRTKVMRCYEIEFGTYNCAYNIMPPFKCGFSNDFKYVAIDKCLIKEILDLWEKGIRTTGCCCGHGKKDMAFIGVEFEDIPKMKALGYKVYFNSCRPNDEDSFIPKTILDYGEINKGFNWWDEAERRTDNA